MKQDGPLSPGRRPRCRSGRIDRDEGRHMTKLYKTTARFDDRIVGMRAGSITGMLGGHGAG